MIPMNMNPQDVFGVEQRLTAGLSDVLQGGTQEFLQGNLLTLALPAGQTVRH